MPLWLCSSFLALWRASRRTAYGVAAAISLSQAATAASLHHPLDLRLPDGTVVENCADPSVLQGQRPGDPAWTMVCTQDPLHDRDRNADGSLRFRRLPMFRSDDLVRWQYVGDAFDAPPPGATPTAGVWSPELTHADGRYLLYYAITDMADAASPQAGCDSDSAIGVAVADSPLGPWVPQPALVVPPRRAGEGCSFHWTIDPDLVVTPEGRKWLFYGSYGGGIVAQPLDDTGLAVQGEPVAISPAHRFEGAEVVFKDGWYYLFVSAANCCNGELTGYALFAGRSRDVAGPYVDAQGQPLLAARSGGTPVIVQRGDRWIGHGHNSVFQTADGRWWTAYHAVDRTQGRWTGSKLTRRPVLIDELTWVDGWPRLAESDGPAQPPTAQPEADTWTPDSPGRLRWADSFSGRKLGARWRAVRGGLTPRLSGGLLHLPVSDGDINQGTNTAPLWVRNLPRDGELLIQARVALDVPRDGELPEYPQAGFAVLGDDDAYFKLVHVAIHGTRQTEFAMEVPANAKVDADAPRYGNTVVGPPGDWTDLALRLTRQGNRVTATAYTRADGGAWVRGGTWVHEQLGPRLRVALLSMRSGSNTRFKARFDQVRVSSPLQRQLSK